MSGFLRLLFCSSVSLEASTRLHSTSDHHQEHKQYIIQINESTPSQQRPPNTPTLVALIDNPFCPFIRTSMHSCPANHFHRLPV